MRDMDDEKFKLIVTSPPYNLGKEYEGKTPLETYLAMQEYVIQECVRILHPQGSLCWQVGNYVENGEIIPIDAVLFPIFRNLGLKLRNRVVWHFRARATLHQALIRTLRDHKLVDEKRRIHLESRPDQGAC